MRVAIIDTATGKIIALGECDGKRYDQYYVKVIRDGSTDHSAAATLTWAAGVFPALLAGTISEKLQSLDKARREANDDYMAALYDFANRFKAFAGTDPRSREP